MTMKKGFKHSEETRKKMSEARLGKPHSDDRRSRISEANKGRVFEKKFEKTCPCGEVFKTASSHAKFHSVQCKRAAAGHGLRHAPEFQRFEQVCAICSSTEQLVGDHCHTTGKPRGILCRNCNLAIGNMFDRPDLLRSAATYLESV